MDVEDAERLLHLYTAGRRLSAFAFREYYRLPASLVATNKDYIEGIYTRLEAAEKEIQGEYAATRTYAIRPIYLCAIEKVSHFTTKCILGDENSERFGVMCADAYEIMMRHPFVEAFTKVKRSSNKT